MTGWRAWGQKATCKPTITPEWLPHDLLPTTPTLLQPLLRFKPLPPAPVELTVSPSSSHLYRGSCAAAMSPCRWWRSRPAAGSTPASSTGRTHSLGCALRREGGTCRQEAVQVTAKAHVIGAQTNSAASVQAWE